MESILRVHITENNTTVYEMAEALDYSKKYEQEIFLGDNLTHFSDVLGEDILLFCYRDIKKDFDYLRNEIKDISDCTVMLKNGFGSPLYLLLYRDIINSPDVPISEIIDKNESEYNEAKNRIRFLADRSYEWQESNKTTDLDIGEFIYGKVLTYIVKQGNTIFPTEYLYPCKIVDIIDYIFVEMMKRNVRILRCKSCHRYFPDYTKRYIEFCNYGAGTSCRNGKFEKSTDDEHSYNEIMALYKKHYRTLHARLKAKTKRISQLEFAQWTEKARNARELTADGRYSLEEFEKFLKGEEPLNT